MRERLRENSLKVMIGRRNRLPHQSKSSSCREVGQALSPVERLFPQPCVSMRARLAKITAYLDILEILMPSFCIRNCSVDRFIPNRDAAPSGPDTIPFD